MCTLFIYFQPHKNKNIYMHHRSVETVELVHTIPSSRSVSLQIESGVEEEVRLKTLWSRLAAVGMFHRLNALKRLCHSVISHSVMFQLTSALTHAYRKQNIQDIYRHVSQSNLYFYKRFSD